MYKYSVKSGIAAHILKIRRQPLKIDQEWGYVKSLVGGDYTLNWVFRREFASFVFYSPTQLREIPMGGYFFPAHLFDEEKM